MLTSGSSRNKMQRPFRSCLHFFYKMLIIFIIIASMYIAPDSSKFWQIVCSSVPTFKWLTVVYPVVMTAAVELMNRYISLCRYLSGFSVSPGVMTLCVPNEGHRTGSCEGKRRGPRVGPWLTEAVTRTTKLQRDSISPYVGSHRSNTWLLKIVNWWIV